MPYVERPIDSKAVSVNADEALRRLHDMVFFVPPDANIYALAYGRPKDDHRLPFSERTQDIVDAFITGVQTTLKNRHETVTLRELVLIMNGLVDGSIDALQDSSHPEYIKAAEATTYTLRSSIPAFMISILGIDPLDPTNRGICEAIQQLHEQETDHMNQLKQSAFGEHIVQEVQFPSDW